jgi:hypothetical protein
LIPPDAIQLYRWVLSDGAMDQTDVSGRASVSDRTASHTRAVLVDLLHLRLLRHTATRPNSLVPSSLESATVEIVGPMKADIRVGKRRTETVRSKLSALQPLYFDSRARHRRSGIDVVDPLLAGNAGHNREPFVGDRVHPLVLPNQPTVAGVTSYSCYGSTHAGDQS